MWEETVHGGEEVEGWRDKGVGRTIYLKANPGEGQPTRIKPFYDLRE